MEDVQIRVRDGMRQTVGTVGAPISFEAILRHEPPSTWTLTLPADDPMATHLVPGAGIRFRTGQGELLSGPAKTISESRGGQQGGDPDAGGAGEGPGGTLTVSGEDDTAVLARRLVYPDPTVSLDSTATTMGTGHYAVSGAAETAMRDLVTVQAGPGALTDRQVPGLTLATDQARGANVEDQFRFAELLPSLQKLATSGGLGFRVRQTGTDRQFQVYEPADLSGTARYSLGLGNLNSYSYEITPPTVTDVIVGVGGQDTAREFYRFTRVDPVWPDIRVEQFVDRRDLEPGTAEADSKTGQEAQERLDEGVGSAKISFEPIDTPNLTMFTDVGLGDTVSLELARGTVTQVIREIRVTLDDQQGWRAVPVIGADGTTSSPQIYQAVGRLIRRVQHLETSR